MPGLLATLPLHLACQLIGSGNLGHGNVTIVEDTSVPNYTSVLPQGYVSFPDVGMAYKYYKNKLTWNAARKQCIAEGASLVIVDSFKKNEYLMTVKEKNNGVHTGIHRLFDNTEWTSIKNGLPLGFIPWKADANLNAGTGTCVAMWFDGTGVGPWNCSNVLPAICEIPIFQRYGNELQISQPLAQTLIAN